MQGIHGGKGSKEGGLVVGSGLGWVGTSRWTDREGVQPLAEERAQQDAQHPGDTGTQTVAGYDEPVVFARGPVNAF